MLFVFAVVLVGLWFLGVVGSYAIGASVDLLLVMAVLFLVIELRRSRLDDRNYLELLAAWST